jgi:hypothetical protein
MSTLCTFQLAKFRLKEVAPLSMLAMLATDVVFQPEMSPLNVGWSLNSEFMSATEPTSHSPIGPYVVAAVAGLVVQSATAAWMFSSVTSVTAEAPGGQSTSSSAAIVQNDEPATAYHPGQQVPTLPDAPFGAIRGCWLTCSGFGQSGTGFGRTRCVRAVDFSIVVIAGLDGRRHRKGIEK